MIHADFILVASRESLESRLPWNIVLRNGIRQAFIKVVKRFIDIPANESGKGLRYTWPQYLPRQPGSISFWNDLHADILNDLRESQVLESCDENYSSQRPKNLFYVPPEFRLDGNPLFNRPLRRKEYLAFNYDDVQSELRLIGVKRYSINNMYDDFKDWLAEEGAGSLKLQSHMWHERVSRLFNGKLSLKDKLGDLPFIPLRDGSWVKAKTKHLYLPTQHNDEHIPAGIDIFIIDEAASRDPTRRRFFKFLGIKEYDPQQVCDLILELHRDPALPFSNRAYDGFISDAAYLFNHRSILTTIGAPDIWFVIQLAGVRQLRNSLFYFVNQAVGPSLIEKYKDLPGNPFAVLDPAYEAVICEGKETTIEPFHDWLLKSCTSRIQFVPTLVRREALTFEWNFLCKNDKMDLLQAVKFYWDKYERDETVAKGVRELQIPCMDGITRSLCFLALPTDKLVRECPHLDFAAVPNPTIENWRFLSHFGVLTDCNVVAYLRELRAISNLPVDEVDKEKVRNIYRALGSKADQKTIQ